MLHGSSVGSSVISQPSSRARAYAASSSSRLGRNHDIQAPRAPCPSKQRKISPLPSGSPQTTLAKLGGSPQTKPRRQPERLEPCEARPQVGDVEDGRDFVDPHRSKSSTARSSARRGGRTSRHVHCSASLS